MEGGSGGCILAEGENRDGKVISSAKCEASCSTHCLCVVAKVRGCWGIWWNSDGHNAQGNAKIFGVFRLFVRFSAQPHAECQKNRNDHTRLQQLLIAFETSFGFFSC